MLGLNPGGHLGILLNKGIDESYLLGCCGHLYYEKLTTHQEK